MAPSDDQNAKADASHDRLPAGAAQPEHRADAARVLAGIDGALFSGVQKTSATVHRAAFAERVARLFGDA